MSQEVAERIRHLAALGQFRLTPHAWQRASERSVTMKDIRQAMRDHTSLTSQPDDRWKLLGPDLDGDELTVIVCVEDAVVVVTIF